MAINLSKGKKNSYKDKDTSSRTLEMSQAIRNICLELTLPNVEFDSKSVFGLIKNYITTYDRLLYSEISAYCFNLGNEKESDFHSNLNSLVEYVYSWNYENGLTSLTKIGNTDEIDLRQKTKKVILKLFDHVNLATIQVSSLKRSEDEVRDAAKEQFEALKEDITREMSSQLISLVGIFTAIAFLVFGGFDSLLSIFSNIIIEPVSKVLMIACLWGLVICNGVFILLSCIERITQRQNTKNLTITSKMSQWANLILTTIFLITSWIYFIDNKNLGGRILSFIMKNQDNVFWWGIVLIIALFIICTFNLLKKGKK